MIKISLTKRVWFSYILGERTNVLYLKSILLKIILIVSFRI